MIAVLLTVCLLTCVIAVQRTRVARAERDAEREWYAEEQSWWASLRATTS